VYGQLGATNLVITIEFSQDMRTWDEMQTVALDSVTSMTDLFQYARCKVSLDDNTSATFLVIARALPME
jgi:hypothetical protein